MAQAANQVIEREPHSPKPPCDCDRCRQADSRKAELSELLDRIAWIELLSSSSDEPGGEDE